MNELHFFSDGLSRRHISGSLRLLSGPVMFSAVLCLVSGPTLATGKACTQPELEDSEMYVVFNSTDVDAQLILAGGFEGGLTKVEITGPKGVVDIQAEFEDGRDIGQADFQFDTTEPSLGQLKRAYPSGQYRFSAMTTSLSELRNALRLSYKLLPRR